MTPTSSPSLANFDDLLSLIGTGPWNILYVVFLLLHLVLQPSQSLGGVYLAPWVDHICIPAPDHLNKTIKRESCHYVIKFNTTKEETENLEDIVKSVSCKKWSYDGSTFKTTLTSDYNWVCDKDYMRALYQSLYVVGTIVSPLLCGYLADRFGRLKIIVLTRIILSFCSITISFIDNLPMILMLRLVAGFSEILTYLVLALEVCEPKIRAIVAILSGLGWSSGLALWGMLAYFFRDWRTLQLVASLLTLLAFPLLFLIDESPRWLIVSGQTAKAKTILSRAARWNKVTLPSVEEMDELFSIMRKEECLKVDRKSTTTAKNVWRPRLFWNKNTTVITLAMSLCFFCVALVYDGITLAGDLYTNNLYLYMVMAGVVEIPGLVLAVPLVNRFGRKGPMIVCLAGCGVVNFAISFLQKHEAHILSFLAAMSGKLLVTAAFQIVYLYSSELFPTEVRVSGVEFVGAIGQIGATIAPYFSTYLGPIIPWLPSAVYAFLCLLTSFTTMLLQETKNRPLLETIADLASTHTDQRPDTKREEKVERRSTLETTPMI